MMGTKLQLTDSDVSAIGTGKSNRAHGEDDTERLAFV
jgi:hypothetical protein